MSCVRGTLLTVTVAMLLTTARAMALDVPVLRNYVTDHAGVLGSAERDRLEAFLREYDTQTSSQFLVLVVPSLEGMSIEDYALAVAERNRLGREGLDNGLLFLVAVNDRQMRFEVGYGLEPVLTDALTSVIIREVVAPEFRRGNYSGGITAGMHTAVRAASGEFTVERRATQHGDDDGGNLFGLIVFLIIMFLVMRGNRRGGRGGGIWFIGPLGGFRGGGGGFGGGFGGGGFGGFSGGGGGFGGGGSSGGW